MTTYELFMTVINNGKFVLSDMEDKIEIAWLEGKLTTDQKIALNNLADENADNASQMDIPAMLADFEQRISRLESAGVVVWKSGMSTAKGQTVLYDILKEGTLRYCRYDGGRSSTSLSPGKIEGWVILESVGGAVTHIVQKDSDGNIILVPVDSGSDDNESGENAE